MAGVCDAGPSDQSMVEYCTRDESGFSVEELPPGFRFHPSDEEIIIYYLRNKMLYSKFSSIAIGEADLNRCEPWDLPKKSRVGEKEWFFFSRRDRKYPTGMRTNRATELGYWKATGKDKEIYRGRTWLVGMKKTLVFYKGRAPRGMKTSWIMHEYRILEENPNVLSRIPKDEWVVCKVFQKSCIGAKLGGMDCYVDDLLDSPTKLPPLADYSTLREYENISSEKFLTVNRYRGSPPVFSFHGVNNPYSSVLHDTVPKYTSIFPVKRASDDAAELLAHMNCKGPNANETICKLEHSQDTGNITDNKSSLLDHQQLEDICFIFDLDSLWS